MPYSGVGDHVITCVRYVPQVGYVYDILHAFSDEESGGRELDSVALDLAEIENIFDERHEGRRS